MCLPRAGGVDICVLVFIVLNRCPVQVGVYLGFWLIAVLAMVIRFVFLRGVSSSVVGIGYSQPVRADLGWVFRSH